MILILALLLAANPVALKAARMFDARTGVVVQPGPGACLVVGLLIAIDGGAVPGPRMITALSAVGSRGGHADLDPFPFHRVPPAGVERGVCNGPEECRAAVRWQLKYGARVIKFMASGGVLSLGDPVDNPQLTQAEMDAIVQEAHAWGRKAAAHCHGDAPAKRAVQAGVDSIEHGTFLKPDTLALMQRKGVFLMPGPIQDPAGLPADFAQKFPPAIVETAVAATKAWPELIKSAQQV